jgi:stage II sporulation protein D
LQSGTIELQEAGGVLETDLDQVVFWSRKRSRHISLNGKKYRGRVRVVTSGNPSTLVGINELNLEDYLKGVVPLEMGIKLITGQGDKQALKAQAVAARTYALSKLGQSANRPYDLESTVADQVYGGFGQEEDLINQAISETAGEVLAHNGRPIKAYFHANSGGHTEDIEKAWPWKPKEEYLLARPDSGYDDWAKNYEWSLAYSKAALEKSISQYLGALQGDSSLRCGSLLDLQIMEKSPSGRVVLLKIIGEQGEWLVKSDSIRWCFRKSSPSGGILPSTKFDINITRNQANEIFSVEFCGTGNGHGVGMSQIGALGRARAGLTYVEILVHYYPGTRLMRQY